MLRLNFCEQKDSAYRVLCLGAHCDDIEIGCGGTILSLLDKHPNAIFYWVVFSSDQTRAKEAQNCANAFLSSAKSKTIVIKNFRDGFFPFLGADIKEYFEALKKEFAPDLIFTHYRNDLHQDHRLVSELTWNTFRDHLVLEYEVPKYDGDLGSPNFFVHLEEPTSRKKIKHIIHHFRSQSPKHWFREAGFSSILRLRGQESNAASNYAEAFYCRKIVWG